MTLSLLCEMRRPQALTALAGKFLVDPQLGTLWFGAVLSASSFDFYKKPAGRRHHSHLTAGAWTPRCW